MKNLVKIFTLLLIILFTNNSTYSVTNYDWIQYIQRRIEKDNDSLNYKNKLNVFLYYQIYDEFCRKYGYKYVCKNYTETTPERIEIEYNAHNPSEYQRFYNKYKDYITGAKAPTLEYINAQNEFARRNAKVLKTESTNTTKYYQSLKVNASEKAKEIEVDNAYRKACSQNIKPKPYSVVSTLQYYKKLNRDDIKMILEHLQYRLNTSEIILTDTNRVSSFGEKILTDKEIEQILYKYEYQPEKFREYAPELDNKYSKYYLPNY